MVINKGGGGGEMPMKRISPEESKRRREANKQLSNVGKEDQLRLDRQVAAIVATAKRIERQKDRRAALLERKKNASA